MRIRRRSFITSMVAGASSTSNIALSKRHAQNRSKKLDNEPELDNVSTLGNNNDTQSKLDYRSDVPPSRELSIADLLSIPPDLFAVLKDDTRRKIMAWLQQQDSPKNVTEITVGINGHDSSGIGKHLSRLASVGLLLKEKKGVEVHYSVNRNSPAIRKST